MDEVDVPEWLNTDFIKACLKNDPESSTRGIINELQTEYLVPKGENFCSVLLRLKFNARSEKDDLPELKRIYVLKILFTSGPMQDLIKQLHQFEKEDDMYMRLMPALYSIMEESGEFNKFTCRCYLTDVDKAAIVMEDLNEKGYQVRNKFLGLDLQHCKLVLEKLALLHASSMRYYEKNKSAIIPKYYANGSFLCWEKLNMSEIIIGFLGEQAMVKKLKDFTDSIRDQPAFKKQVESLDKIADGYMKYVYKSYTTSPGNIFNAQLHGDCWNNNFLFQYNKMGQPTNVMTVDLQATFYGSVAVDFMYFMSSCPQESVSEDHFQELVSFYHQQLTDKLLLFRYGGIIPTLKQFQEELKKNLSVAIHAMNFVLPLATMQSDGKKSDSQDEGHLQDIQSSMKQQDGQQATTKKQLAVLRWLQKENFFDDFLKCYA